MPDKWDAEFWGSVVKLVSKLAVVAAVAIGGTSGAEQWASSDLRTEAKWNIGNEYGEAIQDALRRQAACDTALESFARHRDDEEDWAQVLRECHSGE